MSSDLNALCAEMRSAALKVIDEPSGAYRQGVWITLAEEKLIGATSPENVLALLDDYEALLILLREAREAINEADGVIEARSALKALEEEGHVIYDVKRVQQVLGRIDYRLAAK